MTATGDDDADPDSVRLPEPGDRLEKFQGVVEVIAVGPDLCDVDGQHVKYEWVDWPYNRDPADAGPHVVHERLIRRWLAQDYLFNYLDADDDDTNTGDAEADA